MTPDHVGQQTFVDLQIAFVLIAFADIMAPGQDAPHLRADTERVPEGADPADQGTDHRADPAQALRPPEDDIAAAVLYLAPSESAFVVDTELVVDGETIQL
jgi:NAD(P)-dependent dehydrogenase (short-subunit alcohol dehydrogenase family)